MNTIQTKKLTPIAQTNVQAKKTLAAGKKSAEATLLGAEQIRTTQNASTFSKALKKQLTEAEQFAQKGESVRQRETIKQSLIAFSENMHKGRFAEELPDIKKTGEQLISLANKLGVAFDPFIQELKGGGSHSKKLSSSSKKKGESSRSQGGHSSTHSRTSTSSSRASQAASIIPPKHISPTSGWIETEVPNIDPRYYVARPTTPTGNHERTALQRVTIDKRHATQKEMAYTRAQMDLLASHPETRVFNRVLSMTPADRRIDIRPQGAWADSLAVPVPDPRHRENGVRITADDTNFASENVPIVFDDEDNAEHPSAGTGASTLIHHNPFAYDVPESDGKVYGRHVAYSMNPTEAIYNGAAGLGHELTHAKHFATGTTSLDEEREEEKTTGETAAPGYVENKFRQAWGLNPRMSYYQEGVNETPLPTVIDAHDPNINSY